MTSEHSDDSHASSGKWKFTPFLYAILAVGIILIVAGGMSITSYRYFQSSGGQNNGDAFLSNFFLNLVSELVGLAVGLCLAAVIALILTREKLTELAPEFVRLIAELREHKTISRRAARSCVVCAVKVLSEENLDKARDEGLNLDSLRHCPVCDLEVDTSGKRFGPRVCRFCKLESGVWNIKLNRDESQHKSDPAQMKLWP